MNGRNFSIFILRLPLTQPLFLIYSISAMLVRLSMHLSELTLCSIYFRKPDIVPVFWFIITYRMLLLLLKRNVASVRTKPFFSNVIAGIHWSPSPVKKKKITKQKLKIYLSIFFLGGPFLSKIPIVNLVLNLKSEQKSDQWSVVKLLFTK